MRLRCLHALAAVAVLIAVTACQSSQSYSSSPPPIASGPVALPGERPASTALTLPPDAREAPPRQGAQALHY